MLNDNAFKAHKRAAVINLAWAAIESKEGNRGFNFN